MAEMDDDVGREVQQKSDEFPPGMAPKMLSLLKAVTTLEQDMKPLLAHPYHEAFSKESEVPVSAKISKDTCLAVYNTSRGLVGLVRYLLDNHNAILDYVLLGKVQSDRIESHFGHLRKLAGSNYWASVRQFMENEAVIRTRSLIWWSGYSIGDLSGKMTACRQEREVEDMQVAEELVGQTEHEELEDSMKAALGHIAGFEENPGEQVKAIYRSFTELLDRGKLLVPSSTAIDITLDICHIWKGLVKEKTTRRKLLECSLPRRVFVEVVNAHTSENGQLTGASCCKGHGLDKLIRQMAGALFNLFAGNMVRDINSDVHAKRKAGASTERLSPLERAKAGMMEVYTINSLFWMLMKSSGEEIDETLREDYKIEMGRLKDAQGRLAEVEARAQRQPVDTRAAARFIRRGLGISTKEEEGEGGKVLIQLTLITLA
ncbi:Nuclear nucleic acid-binding protein C1D [Chionoecetes opilio]|uniref:Nuclear nucleic acid-binding protein C1D n=1 Tax=Chionoecetes opilio TaxID=41210 RepID=A0A8J4Y1M8_CHIOP|nr:Nuclear nucleic acid-binding protein C1D [Chionoecetes opilio]